MPEPRLLDTPAGQMTVRQAAKHYGQNRNTIIRRLWSGMSVMDALTRPAVWGGKPKPNKRDYIHLPKRVWTPWGFLTVAETRAHTGVDRFVVQDRQNRGWSLDDAVAVPLHISRENWRDRDKWEAGIRKAKAAFYEIGI